jgi:hypothetical protein
MAGNDIGHGPSTSCDLDGLALGAVDQFTETILRFDDVDPIYCLF